MVYRTQARSWFTQFRKVKFIYTLFLHRRLFLFCLSSCWQLIRSERHSTIFTPLRRNGGEKFSAENEQKCEQTFEIFILCFMRAYSDNCLKHKMRTYSNYEVMCAEGKKFHSLMKASRRRKYIVAKLFLIPKKGVYSHETLINSKVYETKEAFKMFR